MGIWQRMFGSKTTSAETKALGSGGSLLTSAARAGGGESRRGTSELLALFNESPPLRSVVSKIADQIRAATWTLERNGVPSTKPGPLAELLARPSPDFSLADFNATLQVWLDLKDEAFVILERDAKGRVREMWLASPSWVRVNTDGSIFVQWPGEGVQTRVPEGEYVWLLCPNPVNPYGRGLGLGDVLSDDLDTEEACSKFIKAFFRNNARPDVLFVLKGVQNASQLEQAKLYWESQLRGSGRNNRIHFAAGEVAVQEFGQNFKDTNIVGLRADLTARVRETYGISPELFGALSSSNRATIVEALRILDLTVVQPRLRRLRDFWQVLADKVEPGLTVVVKTNLPEDRDYKLAVLQAAPWCASVNEWRRLASLPDVPDGSVYLVSPTLVAVESHSAIAFEALPPAPLPAVEAPPKQHALPARRAKASDADDIDEILEALQPSTLTRRAGPVHRAKVEEWGDKSLGALGVSDSFDMLKPFVVEHLAKFSSERITMINETTRRAIRGELAEGLAAGEGARDLSARVRSVFATASRSRALNIARTEANRSSNFATREAWDQSGVVHGKQWVATPDDRTRDEHAALDGQVADLGDDFKIEGYSADYPGDFGEPEMDCNCRCTIAAITAQRAAGLETKEERVSEWKRYDRALIGWERALRSAFAQGFREQERDALAVLDTLFE